MWGKLKDKSFKLLHKNKLMFSWNHSFFLDKLLTFKLKINEEISIFMQWWHNFKYISYKSLCYT